MKKIVDFIIEKRILILVLFNIFAIVCVFLTNKVNINYDISKYLPKDSEVRQGLDIMEEAFAEDSSSFNLMFKGLDSMQKSRICQELKNFDNVKEIEYDESEDFNIKDYTLYKITVNGDADSKEASNTYKEILSQYEDYEIKTSGDVDVRNKEILPLYILVAAVSCGTIILIIMSDSVMEVFLFLFTILIAVLLNKGTNIIFPSVSNITNSISAILQLALSMDYSIILMNRYRQEQNNKKSKIEAMKDALYKSVSSISSSSVTTVVGLMALAFMSFTIGKDMGLVLAKGVICSLISTFFVLPGLILIFDKWIEKTKKKSFSLKFDKLGNVSYKFRYLFLGAFIILFTVSYFLKGNLGIYYIDNSSDDVAKIFTKTNEIAVIYNNKDEEKVTNCMKELEENEDIDKVVCYGNTINNKLPFNEMNSRLSDLGVDSNIEEYLLKLVYYKKNTNETNTMTFNELTSFIYDVVYKNKDIEIKQEQRDEVSTLRLFADKNSINQARTISDISGILGIDKNAVKDLIIYYNSVNPSVRISIQNFINFMKNNIINNKSYSIDKASKDNIEMLSDLTKKLDTKMTAKNLSALFGMNKEDVDKILIYYTSTKEINTKLTINEFSNIIISSSTLYKDFFTDEMIENAKFLNTFSNKEVINKNMDGKGLASIFDMDESIVNGILMSQGKDALSPYQFVNVLLTSRILTDDSQIRKCQKINQIMKSANSGITYTYSELSSVLDTDASKAKMVYAIYENSTRTTKVSPREFLEFINANDLTKDSRIKTLCNIIHNLNNEFTSNDISKILNIDSENTKLIYGLYKYQENPCLSLNAFINFICNNVMNDKAYSSKFNQASKQKLCGIMQIINSTQNDKKLTSKEIIKLLDGVDEDIDKAAIELIYLYYGSTYEYDEQWVMTIEELINYLNDNVIKDNRFDPYIKTQMKNDIVKSKQDEIDAKKLLKSKDYSRVVISSKMRTEGADIEDLITELKENLKGTDSYIIGDSPMAIEMSESFDDELNLITILTMIFIFIVVAITLKSLIIPVILVFIIQCAVYTTMGILSLIGGNVYFISLLIVQAVLMGATIDYAIVYTTYYLEHRKNFNVKDAIRESYNKSVRTIITSSLILTICTFVVAIFTNAAASRICETICEGAICATILIIFVLPGTLAAINKYF